ncbi:MAG: hypothetical protein IT581_01645 [Verrucomicrobiales bacterium]|nr:hypothetical protein [Verrucomicrobiales bacterium]
MNLDDFEQRLARTPLPTPPADLRRDVFEALRRERQGEPTKAVRPGLPGWRGVMAHWFEQLANPGAILGAACAVVVALLAVGSWLDGHRPTAKSVASVAHPKPTRLEVVVALRWQRAELAALMGTEGGVVDEAEPEPMPADSRRNGMRPRSQWQPVRRVLSETVNHDVV